jgi:ketosteroid isomerase-like protein
MSTIDAELRARREAIVREHMESENRQEFEATLGTFSHPRYELMASGRVYDGREAVHDYYLKSRRAVPDQRNELRALHFADDAVIAEFDLLGTPAGSARSFRCPMAAVFMFEGDRITCERVYWDNATIERQLAGE